jgi:hypothetical protein
MFSTVQCVPVIEVEQWSHSLDYSVAGHDYLSPSTKTPARVLLPLAYGKSL